jgi:GT2 family glycosyltransferase
MSSTDQKDPDVKAKADYLFHRLTNTYVNLYRLNKSPLGRVLRVINFLYRLITLRPHRTTLYSSLVNEAEQFITEYKIEVNVQRVGRLAMLFQILKFAVANPHTTWQQMNMYRLKRVMSRLLYGDAAQTAAWVNERFPSAPVGKAEVKLFPIQDDAEQISFVIPAAARPLVSIIIPVYNQYAMTISCLQSVVANTKQVAYEIIIADDCSTDLTSSISERIQGLSVVKTPGNQGFLKNCNLAAMSARGEYILLLNNDTNVQEGWLGYLLKTISDDAVGLVGPKLLFADGVLQEAGGIVWNDASGWNYGRGQDPAAPEFNYTRETDYISGACILLKTSLWKKLGGFDERFCPAYYEDTDLAFSIRALGLKVVYEPKSVVVHFEGVSNGTDLNSGMKKHQVKNRQVFLEKWKTSLADHFSNGQDLFFARDRSRNRKVVVFIDHYVPFFDKDAGSRSTYMYVKAMVGMGYSVKFLGANFFPHQPYTQALQDLGVEVLYGDRFARDWAKWFKDNAKYIDTIYMHRPHITEDFIDVLTRLEPKPKLVYFGHDLHFMRAQRQYEITRDSKFEEESKDWYRREMAIMEKVDLVLYPSDVEVKFVKQEKPKVRVEQLPLFQLSLPKPYAQAGRVGILFVGGFNHTPNVDGLLWFVNKVQPLVSISIELHVVGSSAPQEITDLACQNILVHGYLTDDELIELYQKCRLSIVPLRYGAGVKGKVLEAMQAGMPVITTSIGAEGIPQGRSMFRVADSEVEFAQAVDELYNDEKLCGSLTGKYIAVIEEHFSEKAIQKFIDKHF